MNESPGICDIYGVRMPTISVIISCYNKVDFVEMTIRSVADQHFRNFSCIIVDDVSTDGTADQVRSCLSSLDDDRFRFVEREENGGQMASMLTGLDHCDDPFVAFVDGDDTWHPEFLNSHLQAHLSRHGVAAMSSSDMIVVDDQGTILAGGFPSFRKTDPRDAAPPPQDLKTVEDAGLDLTFVKAGHVGWIWSATSGMMFRRQLIDLMRPDRPESIRICADDYWARSAHMLGGTVRIDRALGSYRMHTSNGWAGNIFVGDLLALGAVDKSIGKQIEMEVAERICAISETISDYDPADKLAVIVIQMLGFARAFRLCGRNQQAYNLLWKHLPKINTHPRGPELLTSESEQAVG